MHKIYSNLRGFNSYSFLMHGQGEIQNYGDQIFNFELTKELDSIYLVGYGEGGFDYHNLGKFGDGSGFSGRSYFSFDDKQ